jgi:hypothetical protein
MEVWERLRCGRIVMRFESLVREYFGDIKDVDSRLLIDYSIVTNPVLNELELY